MKPGYAETITLINRITDAVTEYCNHNDHNPRISLTRDAWDALSGFEHVPTASAFAAGWYMGCRCSVVDGHQSGKDFELR